MRISFDRLQAHNSEAETDGGRQGLLHISLPLPCRIEGITRFGDPGLRPDVPQTYCTHKPVVVRPAQYPEYALARFDLSLHPPDKGQGIRYRMMPEIFEIRIDLFVVAMGK